VTAALDTIIRIISFPLTEELACVGRLFQPRIEREKLPARSIPDG